MRHLRALPAKPRTKDISFADKLSSTAVHAARYLKASGETAATLAKSFYNDAYQFDQLACSSPHFVFFVGSPLERAAASERFWTQLTEELLRSKHDEHISTATGKLVAACELLGRETEGRLAWGITISFASGAARSAGEHTRLSR